MFRSIQPRLLQPAHGLRSYSQSFAAVAQTLPSEGPTHARRTAYYVPRNSRGSIPVFTDQINTKYMTLIRNVEGDVNALAADLKSTLFKPDSPEAKRLRIETKQHRHVVLSGGKWKHEVFEWLKARGF